MDIDHIDHFVKARFNGCKLTPVQIAEKLRTVIKTMDIFDDPDGVPIRISIGTPKESTREDLRDWIEDICDPLETLPEEVRNTPYILYDIWYDAPEDDDDWDTGVEIMMCKG